MGPRKCNNHRIMMRPMFVEADAFLVVLLIAIAAIRGPPPCLSRNDLRLFLWGPRQPPSSHLVLLRTWDAAVQGKKICCLTDAAASSVRSSDELLIPSRNAPLAAIAAQCVAPWLQAAQTHLMR
jgi:hypothetical protein